MIDLQTLNSNKYLGLGCSTFGGSTSKKIAISTLNHCFDNGIFYYDIARSYGYGQAESIVGKFAQKIRHQIIITSKFGILPPANIPFKSLITSGFRLLRKTFPNSNNAVRIISGKTFQRPRFTPTLMTNSLNKSLKELNTDYIDIFLFHESSFDDIMNDDIKSALEKEKDKGKIRVWGANFGDRTELKSFIENPIAIKALQFSYGFDEIYTDIARSDNYISIIYSIFSYVNKLFDKTDETLLNRIRILYPQLDFIKSYAELILYIAFHELKAGIVLLSMTTESHIDRNLFISKSRVLSLQEISDIKLILSNIKVTG